MMETNVDRLRLTPGTYTALFIWERILRIVSEEPLRLNMSTWETMLKGIGNWQKIKPACGTIMCLSGWYNFLTTGDSHGHKRNYQPSATTIESLGGKFLPALYNEQGELLYELMRLFHNANLPSAKAIEQLQSIINVHREELERIRVEVK